VSAAANAFSFPSDPSAAQQSQAPFGQVFQAQAQARPKPSINRRPCLQAAKRSPPAAITCRRNTPQLFFNLQLHKASKWHSPRPPSASPVFTRNAGHPAPKLRKRRSFRQASRLFNLVCQVSVQPSFGVPAARPRAAMDPELAAAVSPACLQLQARAWSGLHLRQACPLLLIGLRPVPPAHPSRHQVRHALRQVRFRRPHRCWSRQRFRHMPRMQGQGQQRYVHMAPHSERGWLPHVPRRRRLLANTVLPQATSALQDYFPSAV